MSWRPAGLISGIKALVPSMLIVALVVTLGATLTAKGGQPTRPTDVLELATPEDVVDGSSSSEATAADGGHRQPPEEIDREAAAGPQLEDVDFLVPVSTPPRIPLPSIEIDRAAAHWPQLGGDDFVEQAPTPSPATLPVARRVGLQAGHWKSAELPAELSRLRASTGIYGGGVAEWELNLDIARRVASRLEMEGLEVDVLPATIPPGYRADAFVALHADGDVNGLFSGFKLATPRVSRIAEADAALMAAITKEYQAATKLPLDYRVSRNMTGYYAFSFRRFQHAIAPTTPAVIVEMGFLTSASDRLTLLGKPDTVAEGIARGVVAFLKERDG